MKYCRKGFYSILYLLFFTSIIACRKTMSAQELEEYITKEENGLVQTTLENNIKVQAIFRPSDLLVFQEVKNRENLTEARIQEVKNNYAGNIYITVNISQDGQDPLYQLGDELAYGEVLKQLAFRMSEKAALVTSTQDTIPVTDYIFSPMYNMSGAVSVLFVFKDVRIASSEWIDFELKDPGLHTGDRKFRFECRDIEKIPEVKMEFKRNL
jgi:hypothetical protein